MNQHRKRWPDTHEDNEDDLKLALQNPSHDELKGRHITDDILFLVNLFRLHFFRRLWCPLWISMEFYDFVPARWFQRPTPRRRIVPDVEMPMSVRYLNRISFHHITLFSYFFFLFFIVDGSKFVPCIDVFSTVWRSLIRRGWSIVFNQFSNTMIYREIFIEIFKIYSFDTLGSRRGKRQGKRQNF